MGLFEDTIGAGMSDPECRRGWLEAEAELTEYYAGTVPHIVKAPPSIVMLPATVALGEYHSACNHRPPFQYAQPIVMASATLETA
jgi:hypothetical protein